MNLGQIKLRQVKFFILSGLSLALLVGATTSWSYPLPPKVEEKTYHWVPDLKSLPSRKAFAIDVISRKPQLNGALYFAPKGHKLYVLSADYKSVEVYDLGPGHTYAAPMVRPLSKPDAWKTEFFKENVLGTEREQAFRAGGFIFRHEGRALQLMSRPGGENLWSTDLGFEPLGLESEGGRALTAWTAFPPKLFFLPLNFAQAYRFNWDQEGEPVRFWECDRNRLALVENLPNRFSRFVFFRHPGGPVNHTIFDFAEAGSSRSEVSGVVSVQGCEDFVISGVFGLVRVRYSQRY